MLTQLAGKENVRALMHEMVAQFIPHTHNRFDDTFERHQTIVNGKTYTTAIKHAKSGSVLLLEKTECGIIRCISDAAGFHAQMMDVGMAQLESEMPKPKKKRKSPKAKAELIAEMAAKTQEAVAEAKPKKPKPRTSKKAKE